MTFTIFLRPHLTRIYPLKQKDGNIEPKRFTIELHPIFSYSVVTYYMYLLQHVHIHFTDEMAFLKSEIMLRKSNNDRINCLS